MNRAEFVERLARGESVTPEEIAEARAADELADLQREAERIRAARQTEADRQLQREREIEKAVAADREAEAAAAEIGEVGRERERMLEQFALRESRARSRWHTAHIQYRSALAALERGAMFPSEQLQRELQSRGAKLHNVAENILNFHFPASALVSRAMAREQAEGNEPEAA